MFSTTAPSEWLLEHRDLLARLPDGARGLDVACGTGRNALLLAELGVDVDAIDIAEAALQELRSASADRGLPVRAIHADVTAIELAAGTYDVIVNVNFLQRSLFPRLSDALSPGGLLIVETFTRDHVAVLGRRMNPAYLLEPNELLRAFAGLRILHYRETILDEILPRAVASLVAQRSRADDGPG